MKKIQVPVILPAVLAVTIVVLGGAIMYMSFKDTGKVEEVIPTQVNDTAEIDITAVHSHLTNAKNRLDSVLAVKGSSLKGELTRYAASDLKQAQAYCTDKEENLSRFLSTTAVALESLGEKLSYGSELTGVDSSNLSAATKAVSDAQSISVKAADEYNRDYLRGEFVLPELTYNQEVTKEQAQTAAAKAVANPVFKEETDTHYSFSESGYILEVSKTDGSMLYRNVGYEQGSGELTAERLSTLTEQAKAVLAGKGFDNVVLMEWQSGAGEISMKFYPIKDNIVYMNAPLGVVLSVSDGSLLGLMISAFVGRDVDDDDKLLSTIKDSYKNYIHITKAVSEYGSDCYMIAYEENSLEYISLWSMEKDREIKAVKYENTAYGRHLLDVSA